MNNNKHIKRTLEARKLTKSITRGQYKRHVETQKGVRGYTIKSREKGKYTIRIRIFDESFNWLGWDNPYTTIWDMLAIYPDKAMNWIYQETGIDLSTASPKEWYTLLYSTGAVEIEGEPSDYAYAKTAIIVSNFVEVAVNSVNRVQK